MREFEGIVEASKAVEAGQEAAEPAAAQEPAQGS
ncbi:hypothetical protein F4559_004888 [Saccharothrix violaceirubra]|uniref:Uncharacterized protein n=1 Tax=Saccharothrix violaceirubra TaxID=413306 RepID=A0A7W7T6M2_9PSEU|nr:hypothetical protein [Saccharothrix violaceirubra]